MSTEHYLRDDISCNHPSCESCPPPIAAPMDDGGDDDVADDSGGAVGAFVAALSPEPRNNTYLVPDVSTVLAQLDLLERAPQLFADVIMLQTVSDQVKRSNFKAYARLRTLMRDVSRRIVPFANENHRETFVERQPGEAAADHQRKLVHSAASWLHAHFAGLGNTVALLSETPAAYHTPSAMDVADHAASPLRVLDTRTYVGEAEAADPALQQLHLSEMVASGLLPASADDAAAGAAGAGAVGVKRTLYPPHWPHNRIVTGLRDRSVFQGTLRVNRDCITEARVAVHGVSGKSDSAGRSLTGGDDMVSVLVSGLRCMNRAVDGDTVVLQLLPKSQWRTPSSKLVETADASAVEKEAASPDETEEEAAAAAIAAAAASAAGAGAAATEGVESASVHDLRESMRQIAAARAKAVAQGNAVAAALSALDVPLPTARVVGIVRRNWRQYCGSLQATDGPAGASDLGEGVAGGDIVASAASVPVLFEPVDAKVPPILIETRQRGALQDKRLVVAIDRWDPEDRYPRGHYVRTIGPIGERAAETEVILAEHDIAWKPFSPEVLACLPPADFTITPENSVGRVDCRHLDVCSVDPPGCKDIDDALHARWLPNGNVEVGVHIADVTHFVRHGTAIDVEAASRANTTYLVEKRLDMLPALLTETLCSLKGNVDRFAFSVTWEYAPQRSTAEAAASAGRVVRNVSTHAEGLLGRDEWAPVPGSTRYFKSIIHSRAALTYAKAQEYIDEAGEEAEASPVKQAIKLLASIARALKAARKAAGALTLASAEVKFLLDSETADPVGVGAYELRETNSMVEEWMLAGNVAVAQRITESYPRYALLRRHPAPPLRNFDPLLAAAAAVNVSLDITSSKALADSLDAAAAASTPYVGRLLRILATRCMLQATYFCSGDLPASERLHYGLAAPIYTHFTSPIRRYADVIVHRLLAASIDIEPLPSAYEDRAGMKRLCDNMNRRHLTAQLAGRASSALHSNIYFKRRVVLQQALVMKIKENGCVVFVPKLGLEGNIPLADPADGGKLLFDERAQSLSSKDGSTRVAIFSEVTVAIYVEERARGRKELVYRMTSPPFHVLPATDADGGAAAPSVVGVKRPRPADSTAVAAGTTGKSKSRG